MQKRTNNNLKFTVMKYELRIKVGRKVVFSRVGTFDSCTSWIKTWEECPMTDEYVYILRPILQD